MVLSRGLNQTHRQSAGRFNSTVLRPDRGRGRGNGPGRGRGSGPGRGSGRGNRPGRGRGGSFSKNTNASNKVAVTPHRFPGVYIAKGKADALVTKNFCPGISIYGEKRIETVVSY